MCIYCVCCRTTLLLYEYQSHCSNIMFEYMYVHACVCVYIPHNCRFHMNFCIIIIMIIIWAAMAYISHSRSNLSFCFMVFSEQNRNANTKLIIVIMRIFTYLAQWDSYQIHNTYIFYNKSTLKKKTTGTHCPTTLGEFSGPRSIGIIIIVMWEIIDSASTHYRIWHKTWIFYCVSWSKPNAKV